MTLSSTIERVVTREGPWLFVEQRAKPYSHEDLTYLQQ